MAYKLQDREQNNKIIRTLLSDAQKEPPKTSANQHIKAMANRAFRVREITRKSQQSMRHMESTAGLSQNETSPESDAIRSMDRKIYDVERLLLHTTKDKAEKTQEKEAQKQHKPNESVQMQETHSNDYKKETSSPQSKIKTRETEHAAYTPKTKAGYQSIRTSDEVKQKKMAEKSAEKARACATTQQKQAAKCTASKKAAKKAAKKTASSTAPKKAISIGGGVGAIVALVLIIIVAIFAVIIVCISSNQVEEQNRQNAGNATASVSDAVLQYEPLIIQYANANGIGRYVALIEAIMMQESGGIGVNVMQVGFGTVNTVEDSIRMGVGYVRTCLEMARVTDPGDMDQIKVALQGYNYGTGYITWVWNNYAGEYTPENAQLFSENQKAALGWSVYGDPQYVEHVLRYYNPGETTIEFVTDGAQFAWPVPGHTNITSYFGSRWGTTHKGIDISDGNISGVPIVASRAGTVTRADNSCTHNYPKNSSCGCGGGYGNRVEISHGDGTSTLYGHMVTITVSVGQTVQQGQVIGYVGCTGHSTGYHLHFEIKQNGTQVDPMNYL